MIEYTAQAASPLVSGEVKMRIGDNALTVTSLFDSIELAFAEMNALALSDYIVTVKADSGDYTLSRMGNRCLPFFDALYDAYNKAVLRSLFIKGSPAVTAKGDFTFTGSESAASPQNESSFTKYSVPVHVYENNVTALPPDLTARRIPLCFLSGMDKGDHKLTLSLDTGESYTFAKLGYDTAPFADAVEKHIRKLREESLAAIKEVDPALSASQASQLARLMPQGAAAPIGRLAAIAPSFAAALESQIAATRAAESYKVFKELCDPARIWVGFRKNEAAADDPSQALRGAASFAGKAGWQAGDEQALSAALMWLIAPSPDGNFAAVEFAEADSATFIYRTGGDFDGFARQINRVLEAIDFKRDVIRLSDEDLLKPENADYRMAAKRTAALQFVRLNFAGRVIHSSVESWKRKLTELWST